MPTERACRRQWIERSAHAPEPEVEGDDITVVIAAVRKNRVCAITMLITNVEVRSFILLLPSFSNALVLLLLLVMVATTNKKKEVDLLAIVEMGTALPIVLGYDMLCASDSIHSPPYNKGYLPLLK